MNLLVIGGTAFVGRAFTESALAAGWTVTHFNRGKTNTNDFKHVETIQGDRKLGFDPLSDRTFDAVVDTCGYLPGDVRLSAEFFRERCNRYLFVSTISVYDTIEGVTEFKEDHPLLPPPADPDTQEVNGETYGPLKVLCEKAVETVYGDQGTIVRPGLIIGPWDPTDRFSYWPLRFARGGQVLSPDPTLRVAWFIDVRDLADFMVHLLQNGQSGIYNVNVGHDWGYMLEQCQTAAGVPSEIFTASEDELAKAEVSYWNDLPLWLPLTHGHALSRLALRNGLSLRPLDQTIHDTMRWLREHRPDLIGKAGLTPERESDAIAKILSERESTEG
ncbi:MAG: NAD-dependent epimerase/dehydratase family protein [Fimbriimonadaceae bacterium]|nr:NAD-dependent epimerase/dehydratase family protein [Fimbriimonadaceae bacterium]